ncbi:MAG: Uma2 family endonuclease [bacterium]
MIKILLESTEEQDRTEKFSEYKKACVPEYWIVDPTKRTV